MTSPKSTAPIPPTVFTWRGVVTGTAAAFVLMPSIATYGVAFGILAAATGLSTLEAALMSAWVCAGGAQMAVLQIWSYPLPVVTLVLTVLAMNSRYILLGAALRPWCHNLPAYQIYPSLLIIGDGNWALSLRAFSGGRNDAGFILGSGLVMWAVWLVSTVSGHLFGQVLGDPKALGIDFMLAAFFATMAVVFFRDRAGIVPLVVGVAVAIVVERLVPGPWYIFAGAVAGSLAGVFRNVRPA